MTLPGIPGISLICVNVLKGFRANTFYLPSNIENNHIVKYLIVHADLLHDKYYNYSKAGPISKKPYYTACTM